MATPPLPREEVKRRIDTINECLEEGYSPIGEYGPVGSALAEASKRLKIHSATLYRTYTTELARRDRGEDAYLPSWCAAKPEFEIPLLPSADTNPADLVDRLVKQSEKVEQAKEARRLIAVRIKIDGPFGIAHFGDPHVDDPGTDWKDLKRHVDIVKATPGLFAGNVGDLTNNWVGRLAKLFAKQEVTHTQAFQLADWLMHEIPWLYLVKGNHDLWSGAGDPLDWICRGMDGLMDKFNLRLEIKPPKGKSVRVNIRHDFPGTSMWNPAHGPSRAAQMGWRDHILVAGHRHTCGYNILKDPASGLVSHAIRVGGFKKHDDFALEKGFPDQNFSPCAVTIINPQSKTEIGLVHTIWDIETAADYLTWLRTRM